MLIAGNWKMNTSRDEAVRLAEAVARAVSGFGMVEIVVCPPFVSLDAVQRALEDTGVRVGAQNVAAEAEGAFTGEVSAAMIRSVGCRYCIVGHSERRQYFGEGDGEVARKLDQALAHDLLPILCVGETLDERREARAQPVVEHQLATAFADRTEEDALHTVIAYEPVWAIGTGETATPAQAQEMHAFIRAWLRERFGGDVARRVPILYGGSMKPANAADLLAQPDVNGGLIGGASLDAAAFADIVRAAAEASA